MKPVSRLLLLLLLARPATAAETNPPPASADGTNAMVITCDGGFEYLAGQAVYRDNVQVLDGEATLSCELLTVYFQTNVWKVERIVAETNVFITQEDKVAFADQAVYTATNELVTLTGNVLLDDPQVWLAAETFVYDRKTGTGRAIGPSIMGSHPGSNSRGPSLFTIPPPGPRSNPP